MSAKKKKKSKRGERGGRTAVSEAGFPVLKAENPFVFPDNVMEYGEPQFFPGNCVGYLETIQEETDEEYEEEEGCSGRHWWTADSDTDTDSVIRVDRVASTATDPSTVNDSCQIPMSATSTMNFADNFSQNSSNLASFSGHFPSMHFRTTATSKPFEMEDLYLLDQLDLAFEETLSKPRARTGFAFTGSDDHPILPHSASVQKQEEAEKPLEVNGHAPPPGQEEGSRERTSSSSDDEQPAEVNEEDFFYSTSEENSSLTETTSSESEESSSDEGGNKDGVVLAEFSLTAGFNNGLFKSHRRSFDGTPNSKSKLKSFRSFDSLNSLAGTELLFSKADTFPSFHEFIKDVTGESESGELPASPPGEDEESRNQISPIISDKVEVTRKSSGEMSSENLSEDSGICDGAGSNGGSGNVSGSGVHDGKFIAKSAFALNPLLVYSSPSASEENSMEVSLGSTNSNHSPSETPNHPDSTEDQSNQLETNHSPRGSSPLSSATTEIGSQPSAPSTGNNPVQLLSGSPHPSATEYLEQILFNISPANFSDKKYEEEEPETPASTLDAPVKTNPSPSLTTRPILTAFRRNSLESAQSGQGQGFSGPALTPSSSAGGIGVGVGARDHNNSYSDTDSDEDEEFTMLERQAQGYFGEYELPSNNNCISTTLNAFPCANEIPEVEVSSSTMTDYNKSTHIPNPYVNEKANANIAKAKAESESEQCGGGNADIHNTYLMSKAEDGQGVNSCVIKSGPMSTLANTPTHSNTSLSPHSNLYNSSSTFNSLRSTANGNANTHPEEPETVKGNNNIHMDLDMDYFKSFESEILSEADVEAHYYNPGEFGSKKPQHTTLTTHPVSSSVSLEPGGREDDSSLLVLPNITKNKKNKPNPKHPGAAVDVAGEFQLPSSSSASKVISGRSNFGSRKVGNVRPGNPDSSSEEEDEGPGVSEPLVVKKKTWTCAVDVDDGSVVPRNQNQNPNVPDILQIQNAQQSGNSMEVVSAVERAGSISPHNKNGTGSGTGTPSPVPIKTYGSRGEVEVFLVSSRTPSPSSPKPAMEGGTILAGASTPGESGTLKSNKTVHFSPVVSEISWRESYTDQGSEFSESSSTENHYDDGRDDEDEDTLTMTNEDEIMGRMQHQPQQHNNKQVIERVHVQSQVMQEPTPLITQQISPSGDNAPNTLSMVPDLLSQCENVNLPSQQENHTHIEVRIEEQHPEEKSPKEFIVTQSQSQQQQIFPAMFADTKDSKSGVKSTAPAAGKKSAKKGFILGKSKDKDKDKDKSAKGNSNPTPNTNNEETKQQQKQEKEKDKPSFFQRLSKIRLSGSSGNKSKKVKIHPKEKENAEPTIIGKDEVDRKAGSTVASPIAAAPILKKNGTTNGTATQPPADPASTIYYNKNGHVMNSQIHEGEECSAAFESILEEIAGLNTIRTRQARASDNKRTFAERNQFLSNPEIDRNKDRDGDTLESKLSQFKADASKTRDEIAKSHPDFETIEDVTRSKSIAAASPKATSSPTLSESSDPRTPPKSPTGENNEGQSGSEKKREREWYKLLKSAAEKYYYGGKVSRSQPTPTAENPSGPGFRSTGIVETDLDTGASREMLDAELIDLEFEKPEVIASSPPPRPPLPKSPTANGKARSLTNLHGGGLKFSLPPDSYAPNGDNGVIDIDTLCNEAEERAKSFEFLLDETQKSSSVPPENQLRNEARQLSEHELRIQRSLQKLNVPDWYRKHGHHDNHLSLANERSSVDPTTPDRSSQTTAALKLLKRSDYGSASGLAGGWAGLSAYRTPSLSSLQNSGRYTGSLTRSNFVRGRPATMSAMRSSRESLLSPSSTASHSPSAFERCSFTYGMPYSLSRYGTSRLSSTSGASPVNSSPPATPGPLSAAASTRKPYLGWRSQERLNAAAPGGTGAPKLSFYRPPAERLAAEVLTLRQKTTPNPLRPTGVDRPPLPKPPPRAGKQKEHDTPILPNSPSVHDSIREVTDAINQFVSHGQDEPPRPTPRQKSGKKQSVWIESSFVGRKPHVTN